MLQDEKSLPPDDFRQVEKTPQLPREYSVAPLSVVNIKLIQSNKLTLSVYTPWEQMTQMFYEVIKV